MYQVTPSVWSRMAPSSSANALSLPSPPIMTTTPHEKKAEPGDAVSGFSRLLASHHRRDPLTPDPLPKRGEGDQLSLRNSQSGSDGWSKRSSGRPRPLWGEGWGEGANPGPTRFRSARPRWCSATSLEFSPGFSKSVNPTARLARGRHADMHFTGFQHQVGLVDAPVQFLAQSSLCRLGPCMLLPHLGTSRPPFS